ncbi:MAG: AAA family ATPase [Chloroflexota bacterium]|nr:AAA family ATPase [Chloroflexota bacterium]
MTRASSAEQPFIAGREREQAILADQLAGALAGRGSLVLVSGDAGIGKTTLVGSLGATAAEVGCLVLTGACFDAGTTPPYGPWLDLIGSAARRNDLPSVPLVPWNSEWLSNAPNADRIVSELGAFLEALVEHGPLVLVIEDLHWADPESLEFLRLIPRQAARMPLLLIGTYRDSDLTLNHRLYQLLPHLVRESSARRISLARIDEGAVRTLLDQRYDLPDADMERLTVHIERRSQGVPFYLLELLRSLEEEQRLRQTLDGWALGDIEQSLVPALARQVIDGRLVRLGAGIRRLLELAAVIGQDVPVLLWRRVSGANDDTIDEAVERATDAHVLEAAPAATHLRFTHALVRDALYEGIALSRRQRWHALVAETLAGDASSEPDAVAYHFRQALDPRAVEWFIRAGSRAERVAWLTAARHFESALEMMGASDADSGPRGWLLLRRAKLLRIAMPRTSLALLESAALQARIAGDAVLLTYMTFYRGQARCVAGEMQAGIADLETSAVELSRLSAEDLGRVAELERQGIVLDRREVNGLLAALLADTGRLRDALERADAVIDSAGDAPVRGWWARGIALALLGRVVEASHAFSMSRDALLMTSDDSTVAMMFVYQLSLAQLPYGADNLVECRRLAGECEAVWQRSSGALGDIPPRIAWLPLLLIEGDWQDARTLALAGARSSDATSGQHQMSSVILAQLAQAQGDWPLAWELVGATLPAGPDTAPGDSSLADSLALMRIATALCLDRDDLPAAHAWLDAHDRWLAWSGAVLGQADGQNAWTHYYQLAGDLEKARQHAQRAIDLASDPRQPLALLAAHRALGELSTHDGQRSAADQHLRAALALADACAAPYERALTLVALAKLHLRGDAIEEARTALDAARAIYLALDAGPALARADAVAARIRNQTTATALTASAGLSPREIEVLRLVAGGRSNREIAETLFLSARTVERHITNLYAKISARGRSEAIAFAHEHGLT